MIVTTPTSYITNSFAVSSDMAPDDPSTAKAADTPSSPPPTLSLANIATARQVLDTLKASGTQPHITIGDGPCGTHALAGIIADREAFDSLAKSKEAAHDMPDGLPPVAAAAGDADSHQEQTFYGLSQLSILIQFLQSKRMMTEDFQLIVLSHSETSFLGAYILIGDDSPSENSCFIRNLSGTHYEYVVDVIDPKDLSSWPTYSSLK
ncbi:hypothetical protein PRZ48_004268 [Zasmidium cellare]|uniref:OTU domain-containing protein n=1 Tax=Zasmidium cellare TaxID=395010 RepID=A0ABR0EQH7_ZASCE|nr:hypothetical protein PRZ48_004268 [Zasmidium cellare]